MVYLAVCLCRCLSWFGRGVCSRFCCFIFFGILVTPGWCLLTIRIGKRASWMLASLTIIAGLIYTGTLQPHTVRIENLVILQTIFSIGVAGIGVIAPAMLSEIADYGNWKNGTERSALYFSLFTFTSKTAGAFAGALGLAILDGYGFDATATAQSELSALGIKIAIVWIPVLFTLSAIPFIYLSPLNTSCQSIIRRRLHILSFRENKKESHCHDSTL